MLTLFTTIMINNITDNNKSSKTNTAFKAPLSTVKTTADNGYNRADKASIVVTTDNNNKNSNRGGGNLQTSYGHGIWYTEIIDGANNANINNAIVHKQQNINNASGSNNNNCNKDNIVNRNVWLTTSRSDASKNQQKQQQQPHPHPQTLGTQANNECDIIIVDIEDDDDADIDNGNNNNNNEVERQNQQIHQHHQHHRQQSKYSLPAKFFMNANIKLPQKHPTTCASERAKNGITCSVNNNDPHPANDGHVKSVDNGTFNDDDGDDAGQEEDEDDSFASLETLSDNVSIWIDGEKHWVAGVDANTTCSELIWALLNYQNGQPTASQQQTQLHQPASLALAALPAASNGEHIATAVLNKTNSNQYEKHEVLKSQQKHPPKLYDKNVLEFNLRMCANEGSSNMCTGNQPNIQNTAKTNNNYPNTNTTAATSKPITPSTINQSMPINTKENCKITQNSTLAASIATAVTTTFSSASAAASSSLSATPIISSLAPVSDTTPPLTLLPLALPPGIATVSQLATEYVIVKQYHHCEEYLDGSTKVFDVLPPRNGSNKKECELLLRHLGPAPAVYINNTTPQLSSLISTDKDSGMGSPVGSARSAKFRRRKHKSSQWLAQANTLHPKLSRGSANERLMKIILAQDETIQRQLSLLREKERQITKIEEEKHRKRERELGKNYLLETYLNGLDEAECEPEIQNAEEIFIDEPYQRAVITTATTTAALATNSGTAITTSAATLATGTDTTSSTAQALNMMTKHKQREKEKEAKKEKKKQRQKEKLTKDDEIQAKDFNAKTNKGRGDKEKVDKQQQQHQQDLKTIDGNNINNNGTEQEIEMQILWLEKVYTLNKQLQKEEEMAAKLHAKVRKHQLKKAQQTQQEVQLEIDKLDDNLALQCGDIRKVEANLMQTNEQLQKKLLLLERLSIEYLQEQQEKEVHHQNGGKEAPISTTAKDTDSVVQNEANILLTNLEKSLDIQKLSLNNIKSKEEVIKLEKILAKPSIELGRANAELIELKPEAMASTHNVTINPAAETVKATNFQPALQHRFSNVNLISKNHCTNFATANNQQQQQQQQQQFLHHNHQLEQAMPLTTSIPLTGQTSHIEETRSNDTVSTSSCMFIDKNMLSSLHVQNAKTIKKQMFHTHTTATATATLTEIATATTTSSQLLPTTPPPPIAFSIPKRQFQHTQQQYMPMASTFLTSRPQNSHQIQATNIVIVQQPSTAASPCSSHFTSTTSSGLSSIPAPTSASATATTSLLIGSRPPNSISPSPSIMAMNTVDISQLGTLV